MLETLVTWFPNVYPEEILEGTWDTLLMLVFSLGGTVLIGLPLGIVLFLTMPRQLLDSPRFYRVASLAVNILRSFPFIVLLVLMITLTRILMGTAIGVSGVVLPLIVGAAPFFARLVETALREVDRGVIEATRAMGATIRQTIFGTLLPEALPGIIAAITNTAIVLIGYTAMAGAVGGGGLGDLAIRYGYHRNQPDVMWLTVILLLILVQAIQVMGDWLVRKTDHR